jgi:hypothetical protein
MLVFLLAYLQIFLFAPSSQPSSIDSLPLTFESLAVTLRTTRFNIK